MTTLGNQEKRIGAPTDVDSVNNAVAKFLEGKTLPLTNAQVAEFFAETMKTFRYDQRLRDLALEKLAQQLGITPEDLRKKLVLRRVS